jgi:enoyl-[acyl-carrier protein] reductase I
MEVIDLAGRRGLVVGVANADSLAWSAARHFRNAGAELAMTYYNEKARPFVAPLAEEVQAQLLPCNVLQEGQLETVFDALRERWGKLDFVFHSIASARKEDLQGRLTDCSGAGFAEAMLVSCHSLIRMARLAEPLMRDGGSLTTVSYYGAEKVVEHYNVMGPVKAALEASVRTRAASGITHFDELLDEAARRSPQRRTVDGCEVGRVALLLASPYASAITGEVVHVDAGFHVEGMVFH